MKETVEEKKEEKVKTKKATKQKKTTEKNGTKKKKIKFSDSQAEYEVFQYLREQNRPHNATKVFENLNKKFGQKQVKTVLENLVQSNKIMERCGIFWINQSIVAEEVGKKPIGEELQKLTEERKEEIEDFKLKLKEIEEKIAAVKETPSPEELKKLILEAQNKQETAEEELAKLEKLNEEKENIPEEDDQDLNQLKLEGQFYLSAWKERKRNLMEAIEAIADAQGKKLSAVFEDLGLEEDEKFPGRKLPRNLDAL
eukprot:snap_masked-scaffold_8-processed-gene-6.23-mRNA-1 protein AED:1.00 eAED:1.00 QI:0/-1/0/0/-1/1/1/0/254